LTVGWLGGAPFGAETSEGVRVVGSGPLLSAGPGSPATAVLMFAPVVLLAGLPRAAVGGDDAFTFGSKYSTPSLWLMGIGSSFAQGERVTIWRAFFSVHAGKSSFHTSAIVPANRVTLALASAIILPTT
jgi:hypothetical protein